MKKFIRNTAIAALALTVAATGAVYMPVPFVDNQNVSVTESVGENVLSLAAEYSDSGKYEVYLESFDAAKKIPVIKAVREATGLGLGEAKAFVEGVPKLVKGGMTKAEADELVAKLEEAGGKAERIGGDDEDPTPKQSDPSSTESFEEFFEGLPNKFIAHEGEAKSFITLDCDKEVVYEVHITSMPYDALEKFAEASVLEVSEMIYWFRDYPVCGYVLEPKTADTSFEEKFGVSMQLSNTETPEIMPLGYADSTSGNGMTATPLSKLPGKGQLLSTLEKYVNGTVNAVFDDKAKAEEFAGQLESEFHLPAEITAFSRLSYDGQTYNWVPSSSFETEYNKMISAINNEKPEGEEPEGEEPEGEKTEGEKTENKEPEFGYCWEECLPVSFYTSAIAVGPAAYSGAPALEEPTEYTVTLESFDAAKKIPVIKAVREITGLGLGEAKALVEGAPKVLKEGVDKTDADEIIKKIEEAGGKASKKDPNSGYSISFTDPNEITVTPLSNPTVQANLTLLSDETEQTEVNDWVVTLESFDAAKKIDVIKAIREITGLGLGEAKALVEGAPKEVKGGLSESEAGEIAEKIEAAGGKTSSKGTKSGGTENPKGSTPAPQVSCPSYDTKSVVIIDSYTAEKENDVIAKVAEVLEIEEEQAANIVKFKQIVKTFSADNYDPEELLQAIKEADDSIEFSTKTVENVAIPIDYAPYTNAVRFGSGAGSGTALEEQTEFTVTLESFDAAKKIPVIKAVREITGLGLGEAKALVEGAPKTLKEGVSKADADEMIKKIEEAGGKASKK